MRILYKYLETTKVLEIKEIFYDEENKSLKFYAQDSVQPDFIYQNIEKSDAEEFLKNFIEKGYFDFLSHE